jgi:preprotein translocase subunit SecE
MIAKRVAIEKNAQQHSRVFVPLAQIFITEYTMNSMKKIVQFVRESIAELKKVVWPSREDVISSVKVVIVSTVLIAAVLGVIDALLLLGIDLLF